MATTNSGSGVPPSGAAFGAGMAAAEPWLNTRARRRSWTTRSLCAMRCSGLYPANSPSKGIGVTPFRLPLHREPLDLHGDDVGVGERLHAEEAPVLGT